MVSRHFRRQIRDAVSDVNLKTALDRAAEAYAAARAEAFQGLDFEELRSHLRTHKESSLARIPELASQFRKEAARVGVVVHDAADAREARDIVLGLAASYNARKVVKAKSMLSEEIDLNSHLERAGLQVTETDLGEWICQIAGDRPSHFTAPAIHKTREQIADLLSNITGTRVEPEISTLIQVAREQIRQAFLEADLGVSGANIAIADTGTLVIVSNEGNARLVTSLPERHIALIGYEKLVPSIDEASAILKLLSKSGTGQKMTSYVSFITGPSRTSDIEKTLTLGCHGPREVHIIFVDNGRLALADDAEFREVLYCIKCGACLNTCPVYRSVGGHVFGRTYVGGIGAILTAFYTGLKEAHEIADICSTCGRCVSYCPVKIDIPRMIVGLRRKAAEEQGQPWLQRIFLSGLLANPARLDKAVKMARSAQKVFLPKGGGVDSPLLPFLGLAGLRGLPGLAERSLEERLPKTSRAKGRKHGTLALYPGCVINYVYPEIGKAAAKFLTRLGWQVRLPEGQGCCGIPALLKGDWGTARKLALHNVGIPDFESVDYVITACPTCCSALKHEFGRILGSDTGDAEAASRLAEKVRDFSEFAVSVGDAAAVLGDRWVGVKAAYHDPCHAKHRLGISHEPRELLKLAGCELVEMAHADDCCGFAGSYSLSYPEISESILKRKMESIAATGASVVAADCPGCLLQLRSGFARAGSSVQVLHTAEILAAAGER